MVDSDKVFAGSIPELYDRFLGPLIFQPYAEDLAARLAASKNSKVLETAAGTGVLTRVLVEHLPTGVEITATDLNQPMVDHAAERTAAPNVVWQQADALALPFDDASFDSVVCQFGVMFFPDKLAGYQEAFRVLRSGGRFLFNVWDRIEENEVPHVVTEAVATLFPEDPPRFLARTPHGYHDKNLIESTLRQAGFRTVEVETVARRSRAGSHRDPAIGFCQGTPLRSEIEARNPALLGAATDRAADAVAAQFGEGPIDGKIQGHVFTAVR